MTRRFLIRFLTSPLNSITLKSDLRIRAPLNKQALCQWKAYATNSKDYAHEIVTVDCFDEIKNKNKESYLDMVKIYKTKEIHRRGHVEFIYSALKYMQAFSVEKDLEVYKALIDVLPKGKMIPRNMFQVEFMHYPKQQQCAIDLLEQMEENGVLPDWNMEDQLVNVFGKKGFPVRRFWRMMYWMPKFRNLSPWPLPEPMPHDTYQLAMLAIERITSVDVTTEITVHKTSDVKEAIDDTWIISGQSQDQRELLAKLPDKTPLYVEGGFRVWLKSNAMTYFILRADPPQDFHIPSNTPTDDVSNLELPLFSRPSPKSVAKRRSVHEQEDGAILGVCATGTSSRDSLLSWVRSLETTNPRIASLPVLFSLKSPAEEDLPAQGIEDGEGRTPIPEQPPPPPPQIKRGVDTQ